jgi:hypothetical protein
MSLHHGIACGKEVCVFLPAPVGKKNELRGRGLE